MTRRGPKLTPRTVDLDDPSLYVNPNLARIRFMQRVLEEAEDHGHPPLERAKFLAIFGSNLDELFMVRIAELLQMSRSAKLRPSIDNRSPAEQLAMVRQALLPNLDRSSACWEGSVRPELRERGVRILDYGELSRRQHRWARDYFEEHIFPVLTPLAVDPRHPFPHISNLSMNLAVVLEDPKRGERFARVKVPSMFPRLLPLPGATRATTGRPPANGGTPTNFVWIEDLIAANLHPLFRGLDIVASYPFRITRDAAVDVQENEEDDLLSVVEETVGRRRFGSAVRLEMLDSRPDGHVRDILTRHLGLGANDVYVAGGPLGAADLWQLLRLDRPDLKDAPFDPVVPEAFSKKGSVFDSVRRGDVLLYHPYNSFTPVVDYVREAAQDPQVLAIKLTLYRIDRNSPIVAALLQAVEQGKQVAVLMELKARFDEERNIAWARTLERAGVHVTYGVTGLKTHAKMCLVVRREGDRIARYVHMSTGNYNTETARIYADLGFFTSDSDVGEDVSELFNALTGYSRENRYRKLLVAPGGLRTGFLSRIEREARRHPHHRDGYLAFKMNGLEDKECIKALYRASRAGVRIDLQVRGFCCLRPGIPGVSENITVTSVVGRFLEHARIYYFRNGGNEEILLGSADMMPRNLDRRVELLFPVRDPRMREAIRDRILAVHLADTVKARRMRPDGTYERVRPPSGQLGFDSQAWLLAHPDIWNRPGTDWSADAGIPTFPILPESVLGRRGKEDVTQRRKDSAHRSGAVRELEELR
jgi:polyphosphate kinase